MNDFIPYENGEYRSPEKGPSVLARISPSAAFYADLFRIVLRSGHRAKQSRYGDYDWAASSFEVLRAIERAGVRIEITGVDNFRNLDGPCVFISNHMSTFETFVLPAIVEPVKDTTFVVKQSLMTYPVFGPVMRSRKPVTVGRENPRDDLTAVMEGGTERLAAGRSIIIFPQTTRTNVFDPKLFNTIGVKLARKASVPVIPVALKTDAWSNGRFLKEFGRIYPSRRAHFCFGEPLVIKSRGTEEHNVIIDFIRRKLEQWGAED
jgi:1-acyl-sn-glycerol-3-phosphate acyltransferase